MRVGAVLLAVGMSVVSLAGCSDPAAPEPEPFRYTADQCAAIAERMLDVYDLARLRDGDSPQAGADAAWPIFEASEDYCPDLLDYFPDWRGGETAADVRQRMGLPSTADHPG